MTLQIQGQCFHKLLSCGQSKMRNFLLPKNRSLTQALSWLFSLAEQDGVRDRLVALKTGFHLEARVVQSGFSSMKSCRQNTMESRTRLCLRLLVLGILFACRLVGCICRGFSLCMRSRLGMG